MDDFDDHASSSHATSHLSSGMTGRVEIVERVLGRVDAERFCVGHLSV